MGVPVPDATQGAHGEIVGECSPPLFKCLEQLAAQGEVLFQADPLGRVLALSAENQQAGAHAPAQGKAQTTERTGRQTTAVIVQGGERRICVYYTGRRPAGENLAARLTQRDPGRGNPLVRSEALSSTPAAEAGLSRCHGRAQGRRKFTEFAEDFPAERAGVVAARKRGSAQEDAAREKQLSAEER